jgi:hypothetical protein
MAILEYRPARNGNDAEDYLAIATTTSEDEEGYFLEMSQAKAALFKHTLSRAHAGFPHGLAVAAAKSYLAKFYSVTDSIILARSDQIPARYVDRKLLESQMDIAVVDQENRQLLQYWANDSIVYKGDVIDPEMPEVITEDLFVQDLIRKDKLNFKGRSVQPVKELDDTGISYNTHLSFGIMDDQRRYVPFITLLNEEHPVVSAIYADKFV